MSVPVNHPGTFGEPAARAPRGGAGRSRPSVTNILAQAPAPEPGRERPAVQRLLTADRANLIVFTFAPGQSLPDHRAAHPITVQALRGEPVFGCAGERTVLSPGVVLHLPAQVTHRVDLPATAPGPAVLLLTMLTPDAG